MNKPHKSNVYLDLTIYQNKSKSEVEKELTGLGYKVFAVSVLDQQFIKKADVDMSRIYLFIDNDIVKSLSVG